MKKKLFLCVALTALVATFFGCSNMLNTTVSNDSIVNEMPIQISLKKEVSRYVKAAEWSINEVSSWEVKFTEETTGETEIGYWDDDSSITHEEDATIEVTYDAKNMQFSMSKVATGTYTLEITGTFGQVAYKVYGKLTGFVIDSEKQTSKQMIVDLKRQTTGSLSLTLQLSEELSDNDINDKLQATLTPITGDGKTQTYTVSSDSTKEFYFEKVTSDNLTKTNFTINVSGLASGFYRLSFTDLNTDMKYKYWVPSDCQIIEIADDTTTEATVSLNRSIEKNYYATNDSNFIDYNGLSSSSPAEINTLLTSFTSELPENSYINIYMDSDIPILETSTVKALQNSLNNSKDYEMAISIFQSQSSEIDASLIIETGLSDSTITLNTYIHNDVIIKATDDVTAFTVSKIGNVTSSNYYTEFGVTLINGASITTEEFADVNNVTLYLSAETSDGTDNLSAYVSTPMLTVNNDTDSIASSIISLKADNYKARFDVDSTSETNKTSVYAQLVGSGTTSITSFAEKAAITATSSDKTTYNTGAVIPYNSNEVTFSLDGVTSEIAAYSWLLNESAIGSESTVILTPTKSKYVNTDEENTVSLMIQIGDTWYTTDFTFTFSSTDYSRAVYITEGSYSNYSLNEVVYTNANAESETLSLITVNSTTAFTFDDSQNLWLVSYDTDNSYLKLTKQPKSVSDSSFNNNEALTVYSLTGITFESTPNLDITYDTSNKFIYVLATVYTGTTPTSTVYAFSPANLTSSTTTAGSTVTIDTSSWTTILSAANINSVKFTKFAISGDTAYFADAAYNVFKITNFTDTTSSSPSYVGSLSTNLHIEDTEKLSLADMQIGDGLGNAPDNLYVLIRQVSTYMVFNQGTTYYSRGALCEIDSSNTISTYGFNTSSTKDSGDTTNTFCTPQESSEQVNFYGPLYFAAVSPKKLVIADDGFYHTDSTKNLTNKDGFLEFDIDNSSLSRANANIKITTPEVSGYEVN